MPTTAFDARADLAYSLIAAAPQPSSTGTTVGVLPGQGSFFGTVAPFWVTVWPESQSPNPANATLLRVTAVNDDVLTLDRSQDKLARRTISAGDQIMAALTAESMQTIQSAINALESDIGGLSGLFGHGPGDFDAAGAAAAETVRAQAAEATALHKASNLSDVNDPGASRANVRVPALSPAACVATSNGALSGLPTIDGHAVAAGDLVLLTGQTAASQNGLWQAAASAWARPTEFPAAGQVKSRTVPIIGGVFHSGETWLLNTTAALTVDTDPQAWVSQMFTGPGGIKLAGTDPVTGGIQFTVSSLYGIAAGTGLPYYDSNGATQGEAASVSIDPQTGALAFTLIGGQQT